MRATLGFLLIAVGLTGTYLVLSGKFPPTTTAGGGSGSASTSSSGSGGMSVQSAYTQLGTTTGIRGRDIRAPRGFKS